MYWNRFGSFCLLLAVIIIGNLGLSGCASVNNFETSGEIVVDRPEVFTRERLLTRRYDELQWLEKKLAFDSLDTRFQGYQDVRLLNQFLSKQTASFDPLKGLAGAQQDQQLKNLTRQNEIANLNQQIEVINLQNQIEKLKAGEGVSSGGDGDNSVGVTKEDLAQTKKEIVEELTQKIKEKGETPTKETKTGVFISKENGKLELTPMPSDGPKQTEAKLSHLDQLRDELAYRNAVQAAMRENELDDTHDLQGMTLYTLKFDMTVQPGDNTNKYGKLHFKVKNASKKNLSKKFNKILKLVDTLGNALIPIARPKQNGANLSGESSLSKRKQTKIEDNSMTLKELIKEYNGKAEIGYAVSHVLKPLNNILDPQADYKKRLIQLEQVVRHISELKSRKVDLLDEIIRLLMEETKDNADEQKALEGIQNFLENNVSVKSQWEIVKGIVKNLNPNEIEARVNEILWFEKWLVDLETQMNQDLLDMQNKYDESKFDEWEKRELIRDVASLNLPENENFKKNPSLDVRKLWAGEDEDSLERRSYKKMLAYVVKFRYERIFLNTGLTNIKIGEPKLSEIADDGYFLLSIDKLSSSDLEAMMIDVKERVTNNTLENQWFVYSIEPKESAQNISDVAAIEKLRNYALSLSGMIPNSGINIDSYNESLMRSQSFLHAIKRQPLAVGYIKGQDEFGWLLGPKFHIKEKQVRNFWSSNWGIFGLLEQFLVGDLFRSNEQVEYRHTPVQHSYQVTLAVPAWWTSLKIETESSWLDRDGRLDGLAGTQRNEYIVTLPADTSGFTRALFHTVVRPRPVIHLNGAGNPGGGLFLVKAGEPADILVRGKDLWRNPQVFVGSQKADTVSILHDMGGLLAHFNKIKNPPSKVKGANPKKNLTVITSNGPAVLPGGVEILPEEKKVSPPSVRVLSNYVVGKEDESKDIVINLDSGKPLPKLTEYKLRVRPKSEFDLLWADVGAPVDVSERNGMLELKFNFKLVKWIWSSKYTNKSSFLEMDLQFRTHPALAFKSILEKGIGTIAYFKEKKNRQPQLKSKKIKYSTIETGGSEKKIIGIKLADQKFSLVFNLSELMFKAYPKLMEILKGKKEFQVVFAISGKEPFDLTLGGSSIELESLKEDKEGKLTLTWGLNQTINGKSEKGFKELFDALLGKGDHKFDLKIKAGGGSEVVPIDGSLTFAKE